MTVVVETDRAGFLAAVDDVLVEFFDRGRTSSAHLPDAVTGLWNALQSGTAGGKRIRPRLLLSVVAGYACELTAWTTRSPAVVTAAALELLHTALIMHDDVIDHDFVRRGVPNVAGTFRDRALVRGFDASASDERGKAASIIAGDLALAAAYRMVAGAGTDQVLVLLDLMDDAVQSAAAGEILDVENSGDLRLPPPEQILQTALLKTAIYSFDVPLQAGAVLAGASEADRELLCRVGQHVGTAYQLVDDLLGVFGKTTATGKTVTGDLTEIKQTLLLAYAAQQPGFERVAPLLARGITDPHDMQTMRAFLESSGAREYVERTAREHADRARREVAESDLPASLAHDLGRLIDSSVERVR